MPTLFKHVESPIKRKLEGRAQADFERRQSAKQRRVEEAEKEKLQKEAATQQQLREQEVKKKLEEAERKRLEEVKLEQQHQEALLRHREMVLEDKRKQQEAEKHRNDSMLKERSKLIHDLKRVTEAHDDLQVKFTNIKQDLEVTNCAKVKLESTVDALSTRILSESVITNDERKILLYWVAFLYSSVSSI